MPISLYISIEFVRTCQAAFIYFDSDIYYEKTKQATKAKSWNLSDDLGQIEYIFSDKTGTLTQVCSLCPDILHSKHVPLQNSMVFRMCSIAGRAYTGDASFQKELVDDVKVSSVGTIPTAEVVQVDLWATNQPSSSSRSRVGEDADLSGKAPDSDKFQDSKLLDDIDEAAKSNYSDPNSRGSSLNNFFTVLSLCHTVLAATDPNTGVVEYKAQSPDESALVQAAADMGFVFLGKDKEILTLRTPKSTHEEKYELLEILEFTSARKRMSVVVRRLDVETNDLLLLTKGADNVIFERTRPGEDELKKDTEKHLNEFASHGLRTLTLGYKPISSATFYFYLFFGSSLNVLFSGRL